MAEHILQRTQVVQRPINNVFDFFADAANLERITPPQLGFRILTERPISVAEGTLIDYVLRLRGVPVKWRTEISVWRPPHEFIDRQLKGPYKQWIHRHTFEDIDGSTTLMKDEIHYRLPFEPFGDLGHFLVKKELNFIFDFRHRAIAEIFG